MWCGVVWRGVVWCGVVVTSNIQSRKTEIDHCSENIKLWVL